MKTFTSFWRSYWHSLFSRTKSPGKPTSTDENIEQKIKLLVSSVFDLPITANNKEISIKEEAIKQLISQEILAESLSQTLSDANNFLSNRRCFLLHKTIFDECQQWEIHAADEMERLVTMTYEPTLENLVMTRVEMFKVYENGEKLKRYWKKIDQEDLILFGESLSKRIERTLNICRKLLDDLEDYEILERLHETDDSDREMGALTGDAIAETLGLITSLKIRPLKNEFDCNNLKVRINEDD